MSRVIQTYIRPTQALSALSHKFDDVFLSNRFRFYFLDSGSEHAGMTKKLKAHVIPAKAGIQALDRYRIYADMY